MKKEEKLTKKNNLKEQLEELIKENQKLREENKKLQELNAMRTDIISLNAHQLRTSLSTIKWIIKMILDGDFGNFSEDQKEIFRKTYESNEKAINLVNEMLLANKTDNLEVEYHFENVDLPKLVETMIFEFTAEAKRKEIEITFKNQGQAFPPVSADKDQIRIVLQNLLENAIRYNKQNGKIIIWLEEKDGKLVTAVADTGIGIDEESKQRIFERFYRAKNAINVSYIGTGLGLSNSKKIIEKHGGNIWFESKENEGSTFYFSLPLANVKEK